MAQICFKISQCKFLSVETAQTWKLDKKTKVQDCVLNGFSEGEKVQYQEALQMP